MLKNKVTERLVFSNLSGMMTQTHAPINTKPAPIPRTGDGPIGPVLIVFGNEKGGSGKSTAALQTAIALLYRGYRIGTIDLDARQGTMTRYLRNRYIFASRHEIDLPAPLHLPIDRSVAETTTAQRTEDMNFMAMAMDELGGSCDFIIIDTPGADTHLTRLAHGLADILITPMNDSMIDLDVLASIDPVTGQINGPSFYTRHVHDLLSAKARDLGRTTDWIVMRNRLSTLDSISKRRIYDILTTLSTQNGFRLANGFGERLIYRDMFLQGLTISDMPRVRPQELLTSSQQAAATETDALIDFINPSAYKKAKAG